MKQQAAHLSNKIARRAQKAADGWATNFWHDYPLGREPKADRETYLKLWEEAKSIAYPDTEALEKEHGYAVDRAWLDELALHTQIVIKESSLCYQHGPIVYTLLRERIARMRSEWDTAKTPRGQQSLTILETGTARGFSAVVMAKAMADDDVAGRIVTMDLLPHHTKMYWNCIDDAEGPKSRAELLAPWAALVTPYIMFFETDSRIGINKLATGRLHFAFLDGAHTYEDVTAEFGMVHQRQRAGDVIIFDDYNTSLFPGLIRGVDEGCERWGYEKRVLGSRDGRAYAIARKKA